MSLAEFKPVPLPKLGGLYTFLKPIDVPSGYSPNLQNVRFLPRAVLTRMGLTSRMVKQGSTFYGLAQVVSNAGAKTLVSLDNFGAVDYQDPVSGNPDPLMRDMAQPGSYMHSHNRFGRVFLSAFNPDLSPASYIRQWNGIRNTTVIANPAAITVVDGSADANWAPGANTYGVAILFETADGQFIVGSQTANWVSAGGKQPNITGIPTGPANVVARWVVFTRFGDASNGSLWRYPQYRIADNVTLLYTAVGFSGTLSRAAQGAAASNCDQIIGNGLGAWPTGVGAIPMPLAHIAPDAPGGPPTAADSANAGSVAIGTHQVWIVFETIFGYLTAPSSAGSWSAAGGKKALISAIPIGPWYVVARRILFSGSGGQDAFYLSTFRIPNNTTTSVEVDFSDTNLLQGTNVNYLFKNFAMPPASGVSSYGGRLVTWGALFALQASVGVDNTSTANLGFDGGWNYTTGAPLNWALDGTFGNGGDKEQFGAFGGDAWRFTSFGPPGTKSGMINNSKVVAMSMFNTQTPYSVSFRLKTNASNPLPVGLTVSVELFSPSLGSLGIVQVTGPQITTRWQEFNGQLTQGLASIPSDLVLRTYLTSGDGNNWVVWIDAIVPYNSLQKIETSTLRISNPFDTETFDNTNGFQFIAQNNGELITASVQLRSFLYVLKERSMHVTYDDTVNPPSLWLNRQIDSTIGCGSPRALVSSDTFIAFSGRPGAYMFTGSRPQKVSQEIQTTWNQINWTASASTHTLLDPQAKLIEFFVPMNGATDPFNSLVLDYSEGLGEEDNPGPRKWGRDLWQNPIRGSLRFENSTVTKNLFNSAPNTQAIYLASSKIYEHTGVDDDGVAIDSFYETAFLKAGDQGTDLFGGLAFYAEGIGALLATLIGVDDVVQQTLKVSTLTSAPGVQFELYGNEETERARARFEANVDGTSFILKGISIYSIPWAVQRPH